LLFRIEALKGSGIDIAPPPRHSFSILETENDPSLVTQIALVVVSLCESVAKTS
jgi:hypothetical protein